MYGKHPSVYRMFSNSNEKAKVHAHKISVLGYLRGADLAKAEASSTAFP